MLNHFDVALEPLRSSLAADGYLLQVESGSTPDKLTLRIRAEAHACPTCLIPADMLAAVAERALADQGLHPVITVIYPESDAGGAHAG